MNSVEPTSPRRQSQHEHLRQSMCQKNKIKKWKQINIKCHTLVPELIQSLQEESLTNGLVAAATVDRRRKRLRRRTGHLLARSCHWHCCSNESGWGGSRMICCHTWLFSSLVQITGWQINRSTQQKMKLKVNKGFRSFSGFFWSLCFNLWKLAHAKMRKVQKVESGCAWRLGLLLLWNFCCFCSWERRCDYCWLRPLVLSSNGSKSTTTSTVSTKEGVKGSTGKTTVWASGTSVVE